MNTLSKKTVTMTILCTLIVSTSNISTSCVAYAQEVQEAELPPDMVTNTVAMSTAITATTSIITEPGQLVQQEEGPSAEETLIEEEVIPAEAAPIGNRWGLILNQDEIDLMARIGELECGGESDIGQQAVFEVILNRVVDPSYPNTVHGVLSQRGQFTTWKNVSSRRATPSQRIMNNLQIVLSGGSAILPFNTVYFSRGSQNKRVQARIGGHVFCNK